MGGWGAGGWVRRAGCTVWGGSGALTTRSGETAASCLAAHPLTFPLPLLPPCPCPPAEHPRPRRVKGRVTLVGDAAGYVTKCSGEGIYFAAKSGRMAGEAIVKASEGGKKMAGACRWLGSLQALPVLLLIATPNSPTGSSLPPPCSCSPSPSPHPPVHPPLLPTSPPPAPAGERALRNYLDEFDRKYWATYKVLDILQKVFYRSNPAREAFVELCKSNYVQKMTFDSYLYKTGEWVPGG